MAWFDKELPSCMGLYISMGIERWVAADFDRVKVDEGMCQPWTPTVVLHLLLYTVSSMEQMVNLA